MTRNYTYDLLKVIALICILLAHVNPPGVIFQLRNFDVPLMILISVWLSIPGISKDNFSYKEYIIKRVKRLVVPTWIFLTIYFIIKLLIGSLDSISTIIASYLLIGGIGYVWVIRIYIFVAILTPIIKKLLDMWGAKKLILVFTCLYFSYEILYLLTNNLKGIVRLFTEAFIWDFIGYSFIVFLGILTYKNKQKNLIKLSFIFGIIFTVLMICLNFTPTQNFKYPVRIYYLSYAFFVGILLFIIIDIIIRKKGIKISKIVLFISKNSMWIYLWHILLLPIINKLFITSQYGFVPRLGLLILLSCIIVIFQNT